jgi:hypothetical protein
MDPAFEAWFKVEKSRMELALGLRKRAIGNSMDSRLSKSRDEHVTTADTKMLLKGTRSFAKEVRAEGLQEGKHIRAVAAQISMVAKHKADAEPKKPKQKGGRRRALRAAPLRVDDMD